MNREGAETFLRLVAEAVMRGSLASAPRPPWPGGPVLGPAPDDGGGAGPDRRPRARRRHR